LIGVVSYGKNNSYTKEYDEEEKCVISAYKNPKVTHILNIRGKPLVYLHLIIALRI